MTCPSSLLEAVGLSCTRGESDLFADLNFTVGAGEALQIEGANGSGKTSLLRILAGLSTPVEGEVRWRGENVSHQRSAYHNELSYLGHHLGLKGELSVAENLRFGAALSGQRHSGERLNAVLNDIQMQDRADLPVRVLSAGQRQRVALARMLFSQSRLWVLDEPFTALDTGGIGLMVSLLERHLAQGGLAVLTSHQAIDLRQGLRRLVLS